VDYDQNYVLICTKGESMPVYWDKMWDERFKEVGYYYGTEPNDFLKANINVFKPKGNILCLAEGEGRNSVFLAQHGFRVTAVDGSQAGFVKLHQLAKERGVHVETKVSDLADFNFGEKQWDGIVSIWCHLPKELLVKVLQNSVRSLSSGGVILIEAYTPDQLKFKTGGPQSIELLNTLSEFQGDLKELDQLHGAEVEREIFEGRGHTGLSSVVQYIGKNRHSPQS
jgi:SAM-dependent methyltransferase